jgi:hypothetical protein
VSRDPVPPVVPRSDVLGRLQRELWIAQNTGETALAQQLQQRIDQVQAASSATPPQRENTSAAPPPRETASAAPQRPARTGTKTTTAKTKPRRSPRVPRI